MKTKINQLINFFLPEKFKNDTGNRRKAIIVIFIFIFVSILILAMWISTRNLSSSNEFPYGMALLITVLSLFVFRKKGSFYLSGHLLGMLVFIFLFPVSLYTGGLFSDDALWLLLGPVLAFFAGNKWTGLIWSSMTMMALGYLYYLEINATESYVKDSLIFDPNYYITSLLFLFFMILGVMFIYENEKTKLIAELGSKRKLLENYNQELEGVVKERTKSLRDSNVKLQRSNSDLEQFAYVASHDLQEPLRMVGNFVQLLEEEYKDKVDATGKSYINFAVDGVTRMSTLIEELLQYSRVGRKGLEVEKTDLNKVLGEKISDLSLLIKNKNVQIDFPQLPTINCIPSQIGMVFYNLINNGIKFNHSKNPKIEINYNETPTHWWFSVKDNGIGIEKKYQEQIFELFKRLHAKEDYSGTGIGLSICKKIIEHHQGELKIESEIGKGSVFKFSIIKEFKQME